MTQEPKTKEYTEFAKVIAQHLKDGNQVVFFFGAGASKTAGIPLAGELMQRWQTENEIEQAPYSTMVKQRFRGQKARDKFFQELCGGKSPSDGHRALASLRNKYPAGIPAILTTNFDTLIEDSLNSACGVISAHDDKEAETLTKQLLSPQDKTSVIKLHGDPWKGTYNTFLELDTLPHTLAKPVEQLFARSTILVFIGYSGCDAGIPGWLDLLPVEHGNIIWCGRDEPDNVIARWLREKKYQHIKVTDFDGLMTSLDERLNLHNAARDTVAAIPDIDSPKVNVDKLLTDYADKCKSEGQLKQQLESMTTKIDSAADMQEVLFKIGEAKAKLQKLQSTCETQRKEHMKELKMDKVEEQLWTTTRSISSARHDIGTYVFDGKCEDEVTIKSNGQMWKVKKVLSSAKFTFDHYRAVTSQSQAEKKRRELKTVKDYNVTCDIDVSNPAQSRKRDSATKSISQGSNKRQKSSVEQVGNDSVKVYLSNGVRKVSELPAEVLQESLGADSVGTYYNTNIRGNYKDEKM